MFAIREFINQGKENVDKKKDFRVSRKHLEEAIKMLKEQNNKQNIGGS
jgi:hypothetical protein